MLLCEIQRKWNRSTISSHSGHEASYETDEVLKSGTSPLLYQICFCWGVQLGCRSLVPWTKNLVRYTEVTGKLQSCWSEGKGSTLSGRGEWAKQEREAQGPVVWKLMSYMLGCEAFSSLYSLDWRPYPVCSRWLPYFTWLEYCQFSPIGYLRKPN